MADDTAAQAVRADREKNLQKRATKALEIANKSVEGLGKDLLLGNYGLNRNVLIAALAQKIYEDLDSST
ncbi:hypothetical protein EXS62_01580 [Candidatus Kaiserbacteria bacterium]|nr:hypothetical protein [Candidatus Kaiserbacteria bacterium]